MSVDELREATDGQAVTRDVFAAAFALRLRRVLVARYGVELGNDLCADALAYAWQHRARVAVMENPAGYLYRVAQSSARRYRRWDNEPRLPREQNGEHRGEEAAPAADLGAALARLNPQQRVAIILVHAHGYSYADAADAIGIPVTTLRNDLHRGLKRLRTLMERDHDL